MAKETVLVQSEPLTLAPDRHLLLRLAPLKISTDGHYWACTCGRSAWSPGAKWRAIRSFKLHCTSSERWERIRAVAAAAAAIGGSEI